jgi:TPR repeat protein
MPTPEPHCHVKKDYRDRYEELTGKSLKTCPIYFVGRYLEQHAAHPPETQLDIAIKALQEGFDGTALRLFRPLAEKGDAKAQYYLAIMYEHGWGAPVDNKNALELYTKAAEQSLVPAETRLGEIYLRGTLVLQDLAKARQWFEKAAKGQSSEAQLHLADIYERGLGVSADPKEAYAWYAVSAKHGNGMAASQRDRILATLSPDAQAQAEARAKALEASLAGSSAP